MQHAMSRTLLVATSSAGLVLGGALSAGASERDDGHYGDHHHHGWAKGWVMVCQTIKDDHHYRDHDGYTKDHSSGYDDSSATIDSRYRYGDDHHDRNRTYEGRYLVRDSRGKSYWVTLKGKRDCETVRVYKGWAKVSVVHRPDNTRLKSASNVWVKVKKNEVARASFVYEAKWDHHDYDHNHDYSHAS